MKKSTVATLLALTACFALALTYLSRPAEGGPLKALPPPEVIVGTQCGQLTQRWTRDAALHVTATTTAATTDLRGTVTTGWDKVVIHNKNLTIWVGVYVIHNRLSEGFGIDTFAEMLVFVPPAGSLTISDEDVIAVHYISETSTADLILERGERG